jgi:hypothetical protein
MTRKTLLILQLVLASAALSTRAAQAPALKVSCTFSNPAYTGSCVVTATRKQNEKPAAACKPILDCLNNPTCVKSYCEGTTIRQGWKLTSAK